MKHSSPLSRRQLGSITVAGALSSLLGACEQAAPVAGAASNGWPRSVDTGHGSVTLARPPQRIVSTSMTLTGTLLAINAPVIASGGSRPNGSVTDEQGFFRQWGAIARARKVQALYHGEANAEAIAAANPDLIVVSGTGADSALKLYEQLSQIAPTMVLDYDNKRWQQLATLLGRACGREADAAALIGRFDAAVAATRAGLQLPPQPSSAMVYYEDNSGANLWTEHSAQGQLLQALGFTLATVPAHVLGNTSMGKRQDIIQIGGEQFADALTGRSLLLFSADEGTRRKVLDNRFLARSAAVAAGEVYALGRDNFRLDYYSASNLLTLLKQRFARR